MRTMIATPNSTDLQDIKANGPVGVHIRMEHLGDELHSRRLVRVLLGELQG